MTLSNLPSFRNENSEAKREWDANALPAVKEFLDTERAGKAQPTSFTSPDPEMGKIP